MTPALNELAARAQWVGWVHRRGTKIPVTPGGDAASSTNSATWSAYQAVASSSQRGFVLTPEDPYTCVDLDRCCDPKTGAIAPGAQRIVGDLNSYTEISPSETGLHVWVCARLHGEGNQIAYDWTADVPGKGGKVEMWDHDRYITVTGKHLPGTPATIEDRQSEIDALRARLWPRKDPAPARPQITWLSDDEVLTAARAAANGGFFNRLWTGELPADYPSESERDMALLQLLAFYTGRDSAQMRRLFEASGCWTSDRKKKKGAGYLERTIARAVTQQRETYQRPRPQTDGTTNGTNGAHGTNGTDRAHGATAHSATAHATDDRPHLHLINTDKGRPKPLLHNAIEVLRHVPEWRGVLRWNEFFGRVEVTRNTPWGHVTQWTDVEIGKTAAWLQEWGVEVGSAIAAEATNIVAADNVFHPVRDYLRALVWDEQPRLGGWLSQYFGVEKTNYSIAVARLWLISAVARIMQPGCKVDHMLVLEGGQGIMKSRGLEALCADLQWFSDDIQDTGREGALQLAGKWIIEWSDLHQVRGSPLERLKAFVTRRVDHVRKPYEKIPRDLPRQTVFCGSTNEETYLTDTSGNRRFLMVRCNPPVKFDELVRDRDQLWAEAVASYKAGETWWIEPGEVLDEAKRQQEERLEGDPWSGSVEEYLSTQLDDVGVSVKHILTQVIQKPMRDCQKRDEMRIGAILRQCGYRRVQDKGEARTRLWRRDTD